MPQLDFDGANSKISADKIQGQSGTTVTIPAGHSLVGDGSGLTNLPAAGITEADQWRVNASSTISGYTEVTANWERVDTDGFGQLGTGMSESSGIFTFPSTGIYLVMWQTTAYGSGGVRPYIGNQISTTTDNTTYSEATAGYTSASANGFYAGTLTTFIFDVTSTSTHKIKFYQIANASSIFEGNTAQSWQVATFIRLGNT